LPDWTRRVSFPFNRLRVSTIFSKHSQFLAALPEPP